MKEQKKYILTINIVMLGIVMLIPGLIKLFVMKPSAISEMLTGLGFPAPVFFAWILILGEIFSGIAILARWKLNYVVWIPIIILVLAGLTTSINWANLGLSQWPIFLLQIGLASNYWLIGNFYAKR